MLVDAGRTILDVNTAFEQLTGWSHSTIIGQPTAVLDGPHTDGAIAESLARALSAGEEWAGEIATYRADGDWFWDRIAFRRIRETESVLFIGTLSDVSEVVQLRERGMEREESVAVLLALAGRIGLNASKAAIARAVADAIVRFGGSHVTVYENDGGSFRALAIAGWPGREDAAQAPELAFTPGQTSPPVFATSVSNGNTTVPMPVWAAALVRDGELLGAITIRRDNEDAAAAPMTERLALTATLAATAFDNIAALDEVKEASERDPLTRLLSHSGLVRRFTTELGRTARARFVGVIHVGLDRFRRVNDAFGHDAGDALLVEIAARITRETGPHAFVARHGADEFIVAFSSLDDAASLQRLTTRLEEAIRRPASVSGNLVYPSASFGRAVRRRGTVPTHELAESVLRAAAIGMHAQKDSRRARRPSAVPMQLLELDSALHKAVEANRILAHFQPQYELAGGRLAGFEALARWIDPEHGPIAPDAFIPLAEENGLIEELGLQMLRLSLDFLERTRDDALTVSVNVSTRQLTEGRFTRGLVTELERRHLKADRLIVEVTESMLVEDYAFVANELHEIRRLGVNVSIDDFGSGYSSLFQLQELPATELKVDRAFVQRGGAVGTSVLQAILRLAQDLSLDVVAEGVEERGQLAMVRELGCTRVQGFLFGPALPPDRALSASGSID